LPGTALEPEQDDDVGDQGAGGRQGHARIQLEGIFYVENPLAATKKFRTPQWMLMEMSSTGLFNRLLQDLAVIGKQERG